jgi:hypothetical protein
MLRMSALRGLAATAQTTDELAGVMKTSKLNEQPDSYGRQPFNVAGFG